MQNLIITIVHPDTHPCFQVSMNFFPPINLSNVINDKFQFCQLNIPVKFDKKIKNKHNQILVKFFVARLLFYKIVKLCHVINLLSLYNMTCVIW